MNNKLLKQYSDLRSKIAALETEESILKTKIVEEMATSGEEKVESDYGTFTMAHRKSWKYSSKVGDIEEKLKIQKFTEQEKGIAKSTETPYLIYKGVKED